MWTIRKKTYLLDLLKLQLNIGIFAWTNVQAFLFIKSGFCVIFETGNT